jgi:hypothetical protein
LKDSKLTITSPNSKFLVAFKIPNSLHIPFYELKGDSEIEIMDDKDETVHANLQKAA